MDAFPATPNPSRRRPLYLFWFCAAVLLSADVVTKLVVLRTLELGGPRVFVLGDVVCLRHIRNSGGLFGLLPGNASYFAVVSVIAVVAILWVLYRSRHRERLQQIALGMVMGGALGNLLDRVRLGGVVDFIDVGIGVHRWPTFNIADTGVSVGVSLLILWLFLTERRREQASEGKADAGTATETEAVDRTA